MVIWRSQTLCFQKCDEQKNNLNKQTKKTANFCYPGGVQSPSPTKLDMVIEEVRLIFVSQKHVPLRLIVSPLGGVESFWENAPA